MGELKFTEDHEWIRLESDGSATIGITDYAQEQLGDVVFVELPDIGTEVTQGEDVAVVESVKAAADVKTPVSGNIADINTALGETPELINQDPAGDAWFFRIAPTNPEELDELMDESSYQNFIANL